MVTAATFAFDDLIEGHSVAHRYEITRDVYEQFIASFGDTNPLHVDEAYARAAGFAGVVAHGAILNGFVSHFVGMVLPGRRALLLSVTLRYASPCHVGDVLVLTGSVSQRVEAQRVVVLGLTVQRVDGPVVARGKAEVKVRDD